jgi:hypothetical protein
VPWKHIEGQQNQKLVFLSLHCQSEFVGPGILCPSLSIQRTEQPDQTFVCAGSGREGKEEGDVGSHHGRVPRLNGLSTSLVFRESLYTALCLCDVKSTKACSSVWLPQALVSLIYCGSSCVISLSNMCWLSANYTIQLTCPD